MINIYYSGRNKVTHQVEMESKPSHTRFQKGTLVPSEQSLRTLGLSELFIWRSENYYTTFFQKYWCPYFDDTVTIASQDRQKSVLKANNLGLNSFGKAALRSTTTNRHISNFGINYL